MQTIQQPYRQELEAIGLMLESLARESAIAEENGDPSAAPTQIAEVGRALQGILEVLTED